MNTSVTLAACLFAVSATAAGCTSKEVPSHDGGATLQGERVIMSTNHQFFKLLQDLIAARPFSVEGVAKITGHRFHEQREQSNDYFSFYASKDDAHSFVREMTLGIPKPASSQPDGMVGLTLAPALCIDKKEILAQYGDHPEVAEPPPPPLHDAPRYIRYKLAWGTLSFGFEHGGRGCLVKVGLDTIKR